MYDVAKVYEVIGEIGAYQLLMFVLIGSANVIPSLVAYSHVFLVATPDYRYINKSFSSCSQNYGFGYQYRINNTTLAN